MRGYRLAAGLGLVLAIGSVGALGSSGTAGSAGAAASARSAPPMALAAQSTAPADLYVAICQPGTTSGDGSQAHPFCTLDEAVAAVQPGQTVMVEPGLYAQRLTIDRSGAPGAPITFVADDHAQKHVYLNKLASLSGAPVISVSGAHDVVIRGFMAFNWKDEGIRVDSSSNVTIEQGLLRDYGQTGVHITGSSSGVTIGQEAITGGPAILVDPGSSAVVATGNDIFPSTLGAAGISVTDSPGTRITGNTVVTTCGPGITLDGDSPSSGVWNNIIQTAKGSVQAPSACPVPAGATGITVSAGSTAQTAIDYNLTDPTSTAAPYSWAGTSYSELGAFRTATGQGSHDLVTGAKLRFDGETNLGWHYLDASSPAVDSADVDAPGERPTDLLDNGRTDNPAVPNSGTGFGYADRGAVETTGPVSMGGQRFRRVHGGGPLDGVASADLILPWAHSAPVGQVDFTFDGTSDHVLSHRTTATHTWDRTGFHCMHMVESLYAFRNGNENLGTGCDVFGAYYTPLTPSRILDTQHAVGVKTKTPLPAHGNLTLPVPAVGSVPGSKISALALNVTVTGATSAGNLTVFGAGTTRPAVTNLNFAAHQTISNQVIVPLTSGLSFHSSSAGTVHVTADLAGYYSGSGSGFKPLRSVRVLDTKKGVGAPAHTIAAQGTLTLTLSPRVPTTATAAVLAVTVNSPTKAGGIIAYPAGKPRPALVNLSFVAKQSRSNLVTVAVSKGKVTFHNTSSGKIQLTADLDGYFGPPSSAADRSFVPSPVRVFDTRKWTPDNTFEWTSPVQAQGHVDVTAPWTEDCDLGCTVPTAWALNITVLKPKKSGLLAAYLYQYGPPRTQGVSFTAGQSVSNLAVGDINDYFNNSKGTVQVIVDEEGYYIQPG
jgi:mRNA-degrading endonuclease toxin of MazEF toxin-antitoxin module